MSVDNYRDVAVLGACDDVVGLLADLLGWRRDLEALIKWVSSFLLMHSFCMPHQVT
jgi:hypothetical protein